MKNNPLTVQVEDDELVIRIGIETLAFAAERQDSWNPFSDTLRDWYQNIRINDQREFAKDFAGILKAEREDGSTILTDLLDKAADMVADDGSTSLDYFDENGKCLTCD